MSPTAMTEPIPHEATVDTFGLPFKAVADYAREEGRTVRADSPLLEVPNEARPI